MKAHDLAEQSVDVLFREVGEDEPAVEGSGARVLFDVGESVVGMAADAVEAPSGTFANRT